MNTINCLNRVQQRTDGKILSQAIVEVDMVKRNLPGYWKYLSFIPEKIRMALTAVLGATIGFLTYEIIYYFNPLTTKATSSWIVSCILGVPRQHCLHSLLTFKHHSPYWKSLGRAYILYSTSGLVGSTANYTMV